MPAPSGFVYPFATSPLVVRKSGSSYTTDFVAEAIAAAALNGVAYYVDPATGNDANNGLSPAARKASASSAIAAGNAGGVPYHIIYRDTGVIRPRANSANGIAPTQPCAIVADGTVAFGTHDLLTYSSVSGITGGFQASRSNVARVLFLGATDAFGNPAELVRQASKAAWDAADPGATGVFFPDTSTVYIKLPGGVTPTNLNTIALLVTSNINLPNSGSKDFFLKGVDLWGGSSGCFYASGAAGKVIAQDCEARFAGASGQLMDGFRIIDVAFSAFERCAADANAKDGFNGTQISAASMAMLTIDCIARDNGRYTSQSNNGLTYHGTMQGIDIDGDYTDNFGGTVHIIDASQMWCVGTKARRSRGDIGMGGTISPTEFITGNTAKMWLEDTLAAPTPANAALLANTGSQILKRNHTSVSGGEFGGGVIGTF